MGKNWKATERKVARSLGTERTPLSGGNSKMTRSDTLDKEIFCEVKHRVHISTVSLFRRTQRMARKEAKKCVLCLKENGQKGECAVIDWGMVPRDV